jgi:hypothetical protein
MRRDAFNVTERELKIINAAAKPGETNPDTASGMARRL